MTKKEKLEIINSVIAERHVLKLGRIMSKYHLSSVEAEKLVDFAIKEGIVNEKGLPPKEKTGWKDKTAEDMADDITAGKKTADKKITAEKKTVEISEKPKSAKKSAKAKTSPPEAKKAENGRNSKPETAEKEAKAPAKTAVPAKATTTVRKKKTAAEKVAGAEKEIADKPAKAEKPDARKRKSKSAELAEAGYEQLTLF